MFVKAASETFAFCKQTSTSGPCRLLEIFSLQGISLYCSDVDKVTPFHPITAINQGTRCPTPYAKLLCKEVYKTSAYEMHILFLKMSISGVPELLLRKEHTSAGHPCRGGGTCDSVSWFCSAQRDIGARRLATNVTTVSSHTHFFGRLQRGIRASGWWGALHTVDGPPRPLSHRSCRGTNTMER